MAGLPDSPTEPDWGPRRRRSNVAERNRIAPRSRRVDAPDRDPIPSPDPPCTVGESSREAAPLPIPEFAQWARNPRTALTFDGPGGVIALERDDVHRIELAGLPETPGTRVPRRLFLAANAGSFQVPSFVKSARAFVRDIKEARYVARMNAYLAGDIIEVPIQTSGLWEANFAELKLEPDAPMSVEYAQLRSWYVMSMRSGLVILPED